jgi:hypothetical protein
MAKLFIMTENTICKERQTSPKAFKMPNNFETKGENVQNCDIQNKEMLNA